MYDNARFPDGEALNQTFPGSGKFNFGASTVTSSHQHVGTARRGAATGPRASLSSSFPSRLLHPASIPLSPLSRSHSPVMAQRPAMKFSPPTRRSTCRNVPVKYSRGFMAAFQSIIGVYLWKIKRHPSWPRTSACQSIDTRCRAASLFFSFFFFYLLYFDARSLVSSFYF